MQIHSLIDYSSNYSEITGCLWFYLKNEGTSFNTDIANDNNFKSFKYKTKLLENTITDNANGILKNATSAMSLKYLRNFRTILEMPLIICKLELWLEGFERSYNGNVFYVIPLLHSVFVCFLLLFFVFLFGLLFSLSLR